MDNNIKRKHATITHTHQSLATIKTKPTLTVQKLPSLIFSTIILLLLLNSFIKNNNNLANSQQIVASLDVNKCLDCLCLASSGCSNKRQLNCQSPDGCGAYKLAFTYWADAGALSPTTNKSRFDDEEDFLSSSSILLLASPRDFEKCAVNLNCARRSVENYFLKYANDCNGDGRIDCLDMAAMHRAGSAACSASWLYETEFWQNFLASGCVAGRMQRIFFDPNTQNEPTTIEQPQKFPEPQAQPNGRRLDRSLIDFEGSSATLIATAVSLPTPTISSRNNTQFALDSSCLECICEAQSNCDLSGRNCNSGEVCGPFAITSGYWLDAGAPGGDWLQCTRTRSCSELAVRNYMSAYGTDCDRDGRVTCADLAAIHHLGASSCHTASELNVRALNPFFSRFDRCRARSLSSSPFRRPQPNSIRQPQPQPQFRPPISSVSNQNSREVSPEVPRPPMNIFRPPAQPETNFDLPPVQPDLSIPQQQPPARNSTAFRPPLPPPPPTPPTQPQQPPQPTSSFSSSSSDFGFESTVDDFPRPPALPPRPTNPSSSSNNQPTSVDANDSNSSDEVPRPPRAANSRDVENNNSSINAECFECICEASTGCNTASRCQSSDVRHTRCGLFLISYEQWLNSGLSAQLVSRDDLLVDPAADERAFYSCVTDRKCAERLLSTLFSPNNNRQALFDCNRDGKIDCYDYAALHQSSRSQCASATFLESQYWTDFNACFGF